MSDQLEGAVYRCPKCTGEFPQLEDGCCPWCGQEAGGYQPKERKAITHVTRKDPSERSKGLLRRLFG